MKFGTLRATCDVRITQPTCQADGGRGADGARLFGSTYRGGWWPVTSGTITPLHPLLEDLCQLAMAGPAITFSIR